MFARLTLAHGAGPPQSLRKSSTIFCPVFPAPFVAGNTGRSLASNPSTNFIHKINSGGEGGIRLLCLLASRSLTAQAHLNRSENPPRFSALYSLLLSSQATQVALSLQIPPQTLSIKLTLAEREGFEPPRPAKVCRFSRPVQSTALPPLLFLDFCL